MLGTSTAALVGWLAVIFIGCELFSNGVEWAGKKLALGQGAVGSILAAVGTALPETMVPVIAILIHRSPGSLEVGVGAIAGAPFMLSTLAFFVTGASVLVYTALGRRTIAVQADATTIGRDIRYFILVYTVAIAAIWSDVHVLRYLTVAFLLGAYGFYVYRTLKDPGETGTDLRDLHLSRILPGETHWQHIVPQVVAGLGLIIYGAHEFVGAVGHLSGLLGFPAFVLSIIITPIATELPEKMNSIIWTRSSKDTLALGNITGAMVFQSCIPVALGVSMVNTWHLHREAAVSAVLSLMSAGISYAILKARRSFSAWGLLSGGLFYAAFFVYVFTRGR